jgi:hypothetical protein
MDGVEALDHPLVVRDDDACRLALASTFRSSAITFMPRSVSSDRHLRGDRVLWRDDGYEKVTAVLLAKGCVGRSGRPG